MDTLADNYTSIIIVLISGILGIIGQGVSVWIGLNELVYNKNSLNQVAIAANYVSGSILIGFIAGIAFNLMQAFPKALSMESVIFTMASGFLAADIFGCFKHHHSIHKIL